MIKRRKKLSTFFGILDKESVDKLEKNVKDIRIKHKPLHLKRIQL